MVTLWYVLPWMVVTLWLILLVLLSFGLWQRQILKAVLPVTRRRETPRLSVLVAARNEASCLETCLRSLFRQDYPNLEIIAINDRSTDATGEIMTRLAAEFQGRMRVIQIEELPAGWFGKSHALHTAVQFVAGEWLCHVDADCELLSDQSLSLAVQEAQDRGVDLLSLTPQFILKSAWEQITVSVCSSEMMFWFQPARVNNPRLKTSFANGAFLLMTRRCYDVVGGWCRFRAEITEDIVLARAAKAAGMKLAVLQNEGIYRTCMYDSISDSWHGWSRIFYGALSPTALMLSISRLTCCSIIPTWGVLLVLGHAWFNASLSVTLWNSALTGWMTVVVLQQICSAMIFRAVGSSVIWSLTQPIGHLILLGMLSRALLNHVGLASTNWSGAVFRRGRIVNVSPPHLLPKVAVQTTQAE